MNPLSAIVLVVAAGSSAVTLGLMSLRRFRRTTADPFASAVATALSACCAIWLSHSDAGAHDVLLFIAGVALVVAFAGLFAGRRA